MKANTVGTRIVAPKATYLRCSQFGHCSSVSVPAPESQKNSNFKDLVIKNRLLLSSETGHKTQLRQANRKVENQYFKKLAKLKKLALN
jgi:hypothetical protein